MQASWWKGESSKPRFLFKIILGTEPEVFAAYVRPDFYCGAVSPGLTFVHFAF